MKAETLQRSTLSQVFPEGEIYSVSDCEWLGLAAAYYGLESVSLADAAKLPSDANVVLLLRNSQVNSGLRKALARARVLVIPISSFDPELEAALYTQRLVTITDYQAACAQGRYWVDNLTNQAGPLVFSAPEADHTERADHSCCCCATPRTDLTCSFSEDLTAAAWLEPVLEPGQWVSVGSLCEVSLRNDPHEQPRQFSLDGTAVASGVLVARDRHCTPAGDARVRAAVELRRALVAAAPITLRVDGGVFTEVRAGGEDFTDAVRGVANPDHGLQVIELGLGTNYNVLPEVRWQVNSQLNEGAGPVHLGIGDGVTGPHMDFIVREATHRFTT
ncbi:MAG TPA: hypothetical protein VMH35_12460 [Streptosporangiaceae bacterium]|nr:hypothetical protein [Streptosporangiaceae bacterium]